MGGRIGRVRLHSLFSKSFFPRYLAVTTVGHIMLPEGRYRIEKLGRGTNAAGDIAGQLECRHSSVAWNCFEMLGKVVS